MKTNIITILAMAALVAALLLSCASQSAPSGGPEDKTPPEAAALTPQSGQTNVDPRTAVTIRFSKWINLAGARGAVSVYPPLEKGFEVKAAKNRITVVPKERFKDNTTYHVVIGTSLKDLRGNALDRPVSVVFSTGAELDSGRLSGVIVPFDPLVTVPKVALYWDGGEGAEDGEGWADASYFAVPVYASQTDSARTFAFSHLREGRYRVVAFTDQFRIGRLRVGDPVFTPLEQTITVTKNAQAIRLYPSDSDTATTPRISEKAQADTTPPKLQSHLPTGQTSHLPELRLVWSKPVRVNLSMVMAVETRPEPRGKPKGGGGVRDTADIAADTAAGAVADTAVNNMVADTTVNTNADTAVDTTVNTAADTTVDTTAKLAVDSVIDTTAADTLHAAPLDSVAFFFASAAGYSDTTRLAPARRLLPGKAYKINIPVLAVRDANGVAAADSIVFTIRTLPADSICYRLHGGADCLEPNDKRKWVYRPLGRGVREMFTVADRNGTFAFDSIPASKGTLMWFIDDNDDNRLTTGKLIPWRAPERFFVLPDTVEAKARWEIEDLQVQGCEEPIPLP